ncbi:MAG: hypothetical protein J6T27_01475 [Alphaproteobacteria bacterium]|nr:hypothetical protein [Alphaproteobacteria bacterium]
MERIFRLFVAPCFALYTAVAMAAVRKPAMYVDPNAYAYMYPYMNNQMRTDLNPGTSVLMTNNPIDVVVKTKRMSEPRRVVPRPATGTTARAATTAPAQTTNSTRRVVARSATNQTTSAPAARATRRVAPRTARENARVTNDTTETITPTYDVPTTRCLAGYTECMDNYCARANTAYNRCYCSSRLTQIDSKYQDEINDMTLQIIRLRGGGQWTDEEMNEYWMDRVGQYVGENSWMRLENAIDIDWPSPEERLQGQTVFLTGHEYCVAHLRNCASMASNMRDAYRSRISRDCDTYEQNMQRVHDAAAAMIEYYSE